MSYITKAIDDKEKLIVLTHPHWIYVATGLFWGIFFIVLGGGLDIYLERFLSDSSLSFLIDLKQQYSFGAITPVSFAFFVIALVLFWPYFSTYISSEIGLTTERIILKSGLILIKVDEVDLEDIRAEHVYHGLLGWLLKYGKIKLDCRFVKDVEVLAIGNPYRFVKASHKARLLHPHIEYDEDKFSKNMKIIESRQKNSSSSEKVTKLKILFKNSFLKSSKNKFKLEK